LGLGLPKRWASAAFSLSKSRSYRKDDDRFDIPKVRDVRVVIVQA
jgi:hypothetical protein